MLLYIYIFCRIYLFLTAAACDCIVSLLEESGERRERFHSLHKKWPWLSRDPTTVHLQHIRSPISHSRPAPLWILGCEVLFCLFYQHFTIFFSPGNTDGAQCLYPFPQLGCLTITMRAWEGKQDGSNVARAVQREESSYLSFYMEGFSAQSASRLFFFLFSFFPQAHSS